MENRIKVKNTFVPEKVHREFYTGGQIQITKDGNLLFCQCRNHITIVNFTSASIQQTVPPNLEEFNAYNDDDFIDDPVLSFSLSKDEDLLVSGHKSGLIKLWKWKDSDLIKTWKSMHKGPLMKLCFSEINNFVASGSTDSAIKVWNIENHTCTFKLGGVEGVVSILEYHTIGNKEILFASGDENIIRGWHLQDNNQQLLYKFSGHFNKVTKIAITPDFSYLISCSREPVVIIWNLNTKKQIRTIPMYESIESIVMLPICFELPGFVKPFKGVAAAFGGEKSKIRIWDILQGAEIYVHEVSHSKEYPIVELMYIENTRSLLEVLADQTITSYKLDFSFSCQKQMKGYLDEILDISFFGENHDNLVVACNSPDVHVFDENMSCNLLRGHTDFVISLGTSRAFPNIIVTGSKDNSIRVWMVKDDIFKCVAIGTRHTASVCAVALSNHTKNGFLVSGSEDNTLKLWQLPVLKYKQCLTLNVSKAEIAHDQPINSVCMSVKDDLIATGSQDKTAKIWSTESLSLLGVLRGHRRAVWCVKFSPVDQVLLTSSADTTLRLWNVREFNCLKTIEGQDCSVLQCDFINHGTQIVSCGNDGLVKVWTIKDNECVATLDKHAAKVWAVAVSADESTFVTGGTDSRIIFWKDKTEETRLEEIKINQEKIEQEQHLSNLLQMNQLLPALQYAITLNRPMQVLKIIENLSLKESDALEETISQLNIDQKESLIKYASEWNTNSRHSYIAQLVLSFVVDEIADNKLKIDNKSLEGLIAYTNRHYNRLASLLEDIQLLPYTVKLMEPHSI